MTQGYLKQHLCHIHWLILSTRRKRAGVRVRVRVLVPLPPRLPSLTVAALVLTKSLTAFKKLALHSCVFIAEVG